MTKEIVGARIAIEQAPPITKEVLVEENSMLELLTTRKKELEDELSKLKLETNLSVLESENKVLRQQTLLGSTNEDLSERKITTLEYDNDLLRNQQKKDCQPIDSSKVIKPPLENELVHDQQAIVHQPSVTSELTEPITAKNQENIGELAYWLSTISTLLFLLQKNLRESNASSTGSYRSRATTSSFFSRIAQVSNLLQQLDFGYSGMLGKLGSQSRIEARYPALLFKQQLTAYVERLYAIILDNLKKEISPPLTLCIQGLFARSGTIGESPKSILSNNMAKQASNVHWQSIVKSLDSTLNILCENYDLEQWCSKTIEHVVTTKSITHSTYNGIWKVLMRWIGTMFWDDKYGGAKGLSQEVNGESYRDIIGL
ncbi:myosin-12-like [Canna indica]|uniref:Myosin-12-like n=1 Tax=Canna indica TaxID=4628 RepID=A0AAQ3Q6X9_9LILI|nr:myosin-12-like [Canna indica]